MKIQIVKKASNRVTPIAACPHFVDPPDGVDSGKRIDKQ